MESQQLQVVRTIPRSESCAAAAPIGMILLDFLDQIRWAKTLAEVNVAAGIARETLAVLLGSG